MSWTIYKLDDCLACEMVAVGLRDAGIEYDSFDLTKAAAEDDAVMRQYTLQGQAAPVVRNADGDFVEPKAVLSGEAFQ